MLIKRIKSFAVVLVSLMVSASYAPDISAQNNLGILLGGFADGMRKAQEAELQRQQLELERQRLDFLMRQRESERLKEQELAEERRRQAEQEEIREAARNNAPRTGTGFYIGNSGFIITNAHVIGDFKDIRLRRHDGEVVSVELFYTDLGKDLALLKSSPSPHYLVLSDKFAVEKGARVYAIGYPLAGLQGVESKITDGVVSSLSGLFNDSALFQITNPIQPGNSGGPLVDANANLVGVIVSTVDAQRFIQATGSIPQNINFAIKKDVLRKFIADADIESVAVSNKSTNKSLAHADKATVMIIAERGSTAVRPEPKRIYARTPPAAADAAENASREGQVTCRIGSSSPVRTSVSKCQIAGGVISD